MCAGWGGAHCAAALGDPRGLLATSFEQCCSEAIHLPSPWWPALAVMMLRNSCHGLQKHSFPPHSKISVGWDGSASDGGGAGRGCRQGAGLLLGSHTEGATAAQGSFLGVSCRRAKSKPNQLGMVKAPLTACPPVSHWPKRAAWLTPALAGQGLAGPVLAGSTAETQGRACEELGTRTPSTMFPSFTYGRLTVGPAPSCPKHQHIWTRNE